MKRKRIYLVIAILVLIISITAVSFALWNSQFTQSSANVINTGCLELKLTNDSNAISLSNQYPISDALGKKFVGYTFTVSNTCTIAAAYNISLDFKTGSSYFTASQIKAYVSGDQTVEPKLLNNFNSSSVLSSGYNSSRLILSDELLPVASNESSTKASKTYTLRIWIDENVTTSDGTNKTFDGKLTINAVSAKNNILAQRVLKDNTVVQTKPNFNSSPYDTYGLFETYDDDGKTYYFRGRVDNNYVSFAKKLWQIVRINGDQTVRLKALENVSVNSVNSAYTYYNSHICTKDNPCTAYEAGTSSPQKIALENWFNTYLNSYKSYIALARFCNDTTFDANNRISNGTPTLKCPDTNVNYGGSYKLNIGMLSADEMNYAGLIISEEDGASNPGYYERIRGYLFTNFAYSMTPFDASSLFVISWGNLEQDSNAISKYISPVINLNAKTTISGGDGTISNPYVVK